MFGMLQGHKAISSIDGCRGDGFDELADLIRDGRQEEEDEDESDDTSQATVWGDVPESCGMEEGRDYGWVRQLHRAAVGLHRGGLHQNKGAG